MFNLVLGVVLYLLINKFDNWSWVDRIWGLMPIAFATNFLCYQKYCEYQKDVDRKLVMTGLIVIWGLRLTHTLWRKGIYSKGN